MTSASSAPHTSSRSERGSSAPAAPSAGPAPAALPPVLDTAQLHALREDAAAGARALHLLDVCWSLAASKGRYTSLAGHRPGAVYLDLDIERAAPARPDAGRHPLPEPEDFAASLRRAGVTEGAAIV